MNKDSFDEFNGGFDEFDGGFEEFYDGITWDGAGKLQR